MTPSTNVQAAINGAPESTTFCFAAGVYPAPSLTPKNGDRFIGAAGAILDGRDGHLRAFSGRATGVTIHNFVIRNYKPGNQNAAIWASEGTSWSIKQNEITQNDGMGIYLGSGTQVVGNYLHHNAQSGYGSQLDGIANAKPLLVDSNEISFNNDQDQYDPGFEAGGGKITLSKDAVVSHNYSHDNHGPGLWTDIDNRNTTYAYNRVENNRGGGIFHEISFNASIHHNSLKNNGVVSAGWLWNAGIQISSSGGQPGGLVEIFENTVVSNAAGNGIGVLQQERGVGPNGKYVVQNVYVHHNTIDLSNGGGSGVVQDNNDAAVFTAARNIRLDYNTYVLGNNTRNLQWNNRSGGKELFQNAGQETHGTFR